VTSTGAFDGAGADDPSTSSANGSSSIPAFLFFFFSFLAFLEDAFIAD
jgi:hypothetical protein